MRDIDALYGSIVREMIERLVLTAFDVEYDYTLDDKQKRVPQRMRSNASCPNTVFDAVSDSDGNIVVRSLCEHVLEKFEFEKHLLTATQRRARAHAEKFVMKCLVRDSLESIRAAARAKVRELAYAEAKRDAIDIIDRARRACEG